MNAYGVGLGVPLPKIEREARPARAPAAALRVRFGRFELDEANARLLCDGKAVDLPPKPFELLCALARRPGSLITKNELLDEVWGHRFVSESVLKTVIGKLRTVLEDDARTPRFIETVPRRGYRFIATPPLEGATARTLDRGHPLAQQIGELLERATGGKALLLLIDHPHGSDRAAQLMDYLARWAPDMSKGKLLPAR